jgi:hypothetical protein
MRTGMSVEYGYAGIKEGFKIAGPSGETAIGYAYGADFPTDVSSPSRGELFLVNVPEHRRRRGAGKAISIRAIEMMKQQHGCETVVMHATSAGGRAIIESLIAEGYISEPIRTSSTGKKEYKILEHAGNPQSREELSVLLENVRVAVFRQTRRSEAFPHLGDWTYYLHKTVHSGPDKWQISWADERGPIGHMVVNTLEDVTRELARPDMEVVEIRRDDPRIGSNPEEMGDGLKKWFNGSQVVDDHGEPLLVYHGSHEEGLTEISKMQTCYGLFFSPDMDTAGYYAGDDCCIYKAYLKVKNLADFDDDLVFDAVASAAFGGYEGKQYVSQERYRHGEEDAEMDGSEFRSWIQKAMQRLHKDSPSIQRFLQKVVRESNEAYPNDQPITLKDLNDDDVFQSVFDFVNDPDDLDIDVLMKEEPRLKEAFDSEYYTFDKGVENVRRAYGSQDFYMDYQDDMLQAAQAMGYDGVVLTDPSSRGESISYVVFSPDQIRIVGTVEEDEAKE